MPGAERSLRLLDDALDYRTFDHETIVLVRRTARYVAINGAGTVLWPLLRTGATSAQLVAALRRHWDIDEGHARRDVDSFLGQLRAEGLLA